MASAAMTNNFKRSKIASKLATTLSITGKLIDTATSIFGAPPFIGLISGACKMGGKLLSPPRLQLSELENQSKKLQISMENSDSIVQEAIQEKLATVQENIKLELARHAIEIRKEIQASFMEISDELLKIQSQLVDVKEMIQKTYCLMLDQRHKQGLETLEAAYKNFLMGSHDLQGTFNDLNNYNYELETIAFQSLNPDKIAQYFKESSRVKEKSEVQEMFNYVIMVRSKYLLLMSAFYMFRDDTERVEKEFRMFNFDFEKIIQLYEEMKEDNFQSALIDSSNIEESDKSNLAAVAKHGSNSKEDKKLQDFLFDLELGYLYPGLIEEQVDYDTLVQCGKDELIELGLKFGERKKLLNAFTILFKTPISSSEVPESIPVTEDMKSSPSQQVNIADDVSAKSKNKCEIPHGKKIFCTMCIL